MFIRDVETGAYWCPTPRPVRSGTPYTVEHHFGFSRFSTTVDNIESTLELTCRCYR